jgi:hypothetical protein
MSAINVLTEFTLCAFFYNQANLAVALGRLSTVCTIECASMAEDVLCDWLDALSLSCPHTEKSQSFHGLLCVLKLAPELVLGRKSASYSLLLCCESWAESATTRESERQFEVDPEHELERHKERSSDEEIRLGLQQILSIMQSHDGGLWSRVINTFSNNGHSLQDIVTYYR